MPLFKFKNPLVITGSIGFATSFDGDMDAQTRQVNTFSIGQSVGTTDDVSFSDVTGSDSVRLVSGSESLTLGYQSISGSNGVQIDGELFTIRDNLTTPNMSVIGSISAKNIIAENQSTEIIQSSGSTTFGNTLDDVHHRTGSVILSGSFNLNGYSIDGISNSSSNQRPTKLSTAFAAKEVLNTGNYGAYIRKSFTKVANSVTSLTASFSAVTASAPSAEGFDSTSINDFMFFREGMLMENDALTLFQKNASTLEIHINSSNLGYTLNDTDEIVGFGKFNA
tara:strand:- start:751 stop:1590 length:840 start_codon:yes stop_codon:yes gene_type:complete